MDKKYIQDLYNQLGGQAKFGSFEDFKSLITTDKNYQKDFHNAFGESTLGSFQDFSSLVSINKTQPVVQKKKFALDSSSEVGSSVSQESKDDFLQKSFPSASFEKDTKGDVNKAAASVERNIPKPYIKEGIGQEQIVDKKQEVFKDEASLIKQKYKKEQEQGYINDFRNATTLPETYKEEETKNVYDEINEIGFLNGVEQGMKNVWNKVIPYMPGSPSSEKELEQLKFDKNFLPKRKEEYRKQLIGQGYKQSEITDEILTKGAIDLEINSRLEDKKLSLANDYLDSLPSEVKDRLKFNTYNKLSAKNPEVEKKFKYIKGLDLDISKDDERLNELKSLSIENKGLTESELKEAENLIKSLESKIKYRTEKYLEFDKERSEITTLEEEYDLFKRNYGFTDKTGRLLNAIADFGLGALQLVNMAKGGPMESLTAMQIASLKNEKDKIAEEKLQKQVNEVKNINDFIDYTSSVVTNQAPNIALAYFTGPTAALAGIGASGTGNKYSELITSNAEGKTDYSKLQMYLASGLYGSAEMLESNTLKMIGVGKGIISKALKNEPTRELFKKGLVKNTIEASKNLASNYKGELKEELTTFGAQKLTDIVVLDMESKDVFENAKADIKSIVKDTGVMTVGLNLFPATVSKVAKAFAPKEYTYYLDKNNKYIDELSKILNDVNSSDFSKKEAKDKIDKVISNNEDGLRKIIENTSKLDDKLIDKVIELESTNSKLRNKANQINNDKTLDKNQKALLLEDLKNEYIANESLREGIVSGRKTPFDILPKKEQTKIKEEAASILKQEAINKGTEESKINISEEDINNKAKELYNTLNNKQDAVQEQSTTEIPVQSETGISETVAEGISEPKPEVVTEQGTQEEVVTQTIIEALNEPSSVFVYDGKKGQLTTIGQTVVLETPNEIIDLGNVDELSDSTLADFGIQKEEELNIELNEDNSVIVNGKTYLNNYSNPDAAISQDKDGNYSVTLDTDNGQKRTFRGQQADQIVYQMKLKNFEQNGTEQDIDTAIELADEAIRIEEEVRQPSAEREGKSVRKGKRRQRTLRQPKEPLTKAEREAIASVESEPQAGLGVNIAEQVGLPPAPEGFDIVTETAPVVESPIEIQESRVESAKSLVQEAKTKAAKKKAMQDLVREESRLAEMKASEKVATEVKPTESELSYEEIMDKIRKEVEATQKEVDDFNSKNNREYRGDSEQQLESELKEAKDKVFEAQQQISRAEDADVAINEYNKAKEKVSEIEQKIKDFKDFNEVSSLIYDQIDSSKKSDYEYRELFNKDPRLAAIQDYKDLLEFLEGRNDEKDSESIPRYKNYIKILEQDIKNNPIKKESKPVNPKTESKIDKEIAQLEKDADYYASKIEDIQDEIKTEKQNTKEEVQRIKDEIAEVKNDKSLNRAEKLDKIEDLKAEMQDIKDDQEGLIENYTFDLKEAKSEYKKTLSKINRLVAKKEAKVDETKDLLNLDTKDKDGLNRVLDFLNKIDDSLDMNPNELNDVTRVMAVNTAKIIVKTLKTLVNAGITLKEAIEKVAEIHSITSDKIIDALDIVSKINENKSEGISEMELPGFNDLSSEIDSQIDEGKSVKEVLDYVQSSETYNNATDVQQDLLVRDVRKRFGLSQKSAPSVGKLFGTIKDVKKITMREKDLLVKQLKDKAKGAKDVIAVQKEVAKEIAKEIKELSSTGKITITQAANIVSKFSKVNLLNETSVYNFVDYMSKVFSDAEYDNKINVAKNKLKSAKNNIVTKLGLADGLVLPLQRLFSINPNLIPEKYLDRYLELVNMFSARQQVLTLEEKSVVLKDVQDILDEIENEQSLSDELADRFESSDSKVFKDGVLDYSASIKSMLKNGEIDNEEADLMTKYKSRIIQREEKTKMTEEEIQAEKNILVNEIKNSTINESGLPTRDEVKLAKAFGRLIKGNAINELTNTELKNVLKLIDNINNGYLPHYTQLMVEKMNSINNSKTLENAIDKSKLPTLSYLYSKAKSVLTKKDAVLEMIRRNPLFYIDQVLGDFKTKDVFNSVLEMAAEGEANFTADFKKVKEKLDKAQNDVAKSFGLNPNKTLKSSFKMMTYAIQLEYESNKGNKQVNPAAEYLKATIKHINDGKSQFNEKDSKVLQEIYDEFSDSEGNINSKKLYDSFNNAEKKAIKTVRELNESLTDKAEYTSAIIRGQKINPLTNYIHLNVLHDSSPTDISSGPSFINDYNNSMRPSTKAKSLIERTGKVSPLNFDIFSSAERGAKFVLMDYNLTEPIRTARKTINRTISNLEKDGKMSDRNRKVANGINQAVEEAIENLLLNSYTSTSIGDDVVNYISKQGYRAVLAGTGRFMAELLSNVGFIIISDPNTFTEGLKHTKLLMSSEAPQIMQNVNSKETNRIFPSDMLSGRLIDTSILSQSTGIRGGKTKNSITNRLEQIWNRTGKKYKNSVELTADALISTPDKAIMRPIWFGSFANQFEKMTGQKVDFKKIAENDSDYMEENREAIDKAKNIADERSVITGASSNAFSGILKGTSKANQSTTIKGFNNFNNFMTRFLIYEYVTARTGIYAAMGNGSLSRRQGVALLGAVTTRMTIYSLLIKALGGGLVGLLFDDEEEEKKSIDRQIGQALASTFTSMLLGRDFGNATKTLINYGVERINEEYLDFLREGDYDPYKDAIQYTSIPSEEKGKQTDISDFILKMGGSFGPALNTADLILKKSFEAEKKEEDAIERSNKEKNVRIPLEVLGNLGFVPLYKDIRKSVLKDIYKGLEDAKEESKVKAEEKAEEQYKLSGYKNKTEMEEKNPRLYKRTFGEGSLYYREKQREKKFENRRKKRFGTD